MRDKIKKALDRYAKDRCPVGGFLTAVLANDLMDAVGRADEDNLENLHEICSYVYNYMPATCHGSRKKVENWLAARAG